MRNSWIGSSVFFSLLFGSGAFAQTPSLLPFQGRVTDSAGNTVNYPVTINFRIFPPTGVCYIYEETQNVTPNDFGIFSVLLGDPSHKSFPTGALVFDLVFNNSPTNILADSCSGTYAPGLNDWRRIQIVVNGFALPQMQTIASAPFAIHSNFLGGRSANDFIQVNGSVTQSNMVTLTGTGDASALHHHDSLYARTDSGNTFSGPVTSNGGFFAPGATGTVGVGTATPSADVHIRKDSPSLRLEMISGNAGTGAIDFSSGANQHASIRSSENTNQLIFQTGTTTALTLDQNQNANFSGNVLSSGFLSIGRYSNAQQSTLQSSYLSTCGFGCLGTIWSNTNDNSINYWDGSGVRTIPKFSPVPYIDGGVVISSATQMSVLSPGTTGQVLTMNGSGQPTWATGPGGTVTAVTAGTGLTGGTITSTGTLAVDVGTAAGKIVQLDGSARLPFVDGSQLTNVNAVSLQGLPVSVTAPSLGSILRYNATNAWERFNCSAGQVLKFNAVTGWDCDTDLGSVTSVSSANSFLSVATPSTTPVLTLNVGTSTNTVAAGDDARIVGALQSAVYNTQVSPAASCSTAQTPYWNSVSGAWACQNINVAGALGYTPLNRAGDSMAGVLGLFQTATDPSTVGWGAAERGRTWFNTTANDVRYWDGTNVRTLGIAGSGVQVLNTLTSSTQTFATGSAGSDFAINSSGSTHTFNIPTASATARGLLGSADWTTFNNKLGAVVGSPLNSAQIWVGNGSNQAAAVAMGGDATIANTGALTLSSTGVSAASYGSTSSVPSFTVDAKGRLTAASGSAYQDATVAQKGIVQIGSNISVSSGTISVSNANVLAAIGYTPVNRAGDSMTGSLSTTGQIRSAQNTIASGATVDFNSGNTQVLSAPGGSTITLNNMQDGASYTVLVTDTTSRTYSFSNCTSTRWAPQQAPTTGQTVFSILRVTIGVTVTCYVSWITGF
jgi:hypothetical protein